MEWGRLYANLPDDPHVQAAEDNGGAGFLLIESMCYLTRSESEGFIPHTQVERFGGGALKKRKIAALVREEIWLPVDGGYLLNPRLWSEERNLTGERDDCRKRISAAVREFVYERDFFRCVKCGATEDLTLDHIYPWSRGGSDTSDNLRVLCRPCNSSKGARI